MSKKQSENVSKRQSRKEELRKKERQQKMIVIGAIALIAIVFVVIFFISTQKAAINKSGGPIQKITLKEYKNANGTTLGDPNAKVKIDVFEDFQCIHCKDYTEGSRTADNSTTGGYWTGLLCLSPAPVSGCA